MTKKKKKEADALRKQIAELEAALQEALTGGVASATMSSSGASQSYTRWRPAELRDEIARKRRLLARLITGSGKRRTEPDFG